MSSISNKKKLGRIDITFTEPISGCFHLHFSLFICKKVLPLLLRSIEDSLNHFICVESSFFPFVFLLHRLFDFITLIKIDYNFFSFHKPRTHTGNHHINTENLALSSFTFFLFLFVASLDLKSRLFFFVTSDCFFPPHCVYIQWHGFGLKWNLTFTHNQHLLKWFDRKTFSLAFCRSALWLL